MKYSKCLQFDIEKYYSEIDPQFIDIFLQIAEVIPTFSSESLYLFKVLFFISCLVTDLLSNLLQQVPQAVSAL